jgi:hypothetical protein
MAMSAGTDAAVVESPTMESIREADGVASNAAVNVPVCVGIELFTQLVPVMVHPAGAKGFTLSTVLTERVVDPSVPVMVSV